MFLSLSLSNSPLWPFVHVRAVILAKFGLCRVLTRPKLSVKSSRRAGAKEIKAEMTRYCSFRFFLLQSAPCSRSRAWIFRLLTTVFRAVSSCAQSWVDLMWGLRTSGSLVAVVMWRDCLYPWIHSLVVSPWLTVCCGKDYSSSLEASRGEQLEK